MKSRTEILVPLAAIQAVPIAVIAWYRLHRYAWYRYSAIVKLTLHIQNEPVNEPVNERQQAILSTMKQNPSITRENLANKLDVSIATFKRELTSLRKKGYISRRGSDKNGQWIILKNQ